MAKCTSNMAVGGVVGWPSMRARVLVRNLSFLWRLVLGDGSNLGSRMLYKIWLINSLIHSGQGRRKRGGGGATGAIAPPKLKQGGHSPPKIL